MGTRIPKVLMTATAGVVVVEIIACEPEGMAGEFVLPCAGPQGEPHTGIGRSQAGRSRRSPRAVLRHYRQNAVARICASCAVSSSS